MRSVASRFPEDLNAPQTAQSAIGQFDVRATPLQMAMVAAAIANRGVLMEPYLVQEVRGPDLSVLDTHQAASRSATAVSPQTARRAHRDDGQGRRAAAPAPTGRSPASRWPARPAPRSRAAGRQPARLVRLVRAGRHRPAGRGRRHRRERRRRSGDQRQPARRPDRAATSCGRCWDVSRCTGTDASARRRYRLTDADRRRRHGRGLAGRGRRARPRRGREGAAPRVRRRPRVPGAVPRRGAAHRGALAPGHRCGLRLRRGRDREGEARVAVPRHGVRAGRAAVGAAGPRRRALARTARSTSSARPRSACRRRTTRASSTATSSPATSWSTPTVS